MKATILGTGAYGIALATMIYKNTKEITIWTPFNEEANELSIKRENKERLPGITIPKEIIITTDLKNAIQDSELIVIATPASAIEEICIKLKPVLKKEQIICIATKGIQKDTCLFLSEVVQKYFENALSVIAGPTFAIDLATNAVCGLTVAATNQKTLDITTTYLENDSLKLQPCFDIIGVEFLSASKNVIALASGILKGLGYAESSNALLLTDTIQELRYFLKELNQGTFKNTIFTYAGIGDLILTCTSSKSRNYSFGEKIGKKIDKEELAAYLKHNTIEGVYTLQSIYQLKTKRNIHLPLIDVLYQIIKKNDDPELLISYLMQKK